MCYVMTKDEASIILRNFYDSEATADSTDAGVLVKNRIHHIFSVINTNLKVILHLFETESLTHIKL